MNISRINKALVAGLTAGLGAIYTATQSNSNITLHEWVAIAIAIAGAAGLTYGVQNALLPQDVPLSTLVQGAKAQGMELSDAGAQLKANKFDELPSAIVKGFPYAEVSE